MSEERLLCRLEELADGASRGFLHQGNDDQVFAVRQGDKVFVWLNDCPHEHRRVAGGTAVQQHLAARGGDPATGRQRRRRWTDSVKPPHR